MFWSFKLSVHEGYFLNDLKWDTARLRALFKLGFEVLIAASYWAQGKVDQVTYKCFILLLDLI